MLIFHYLYPLTINQDMWSFKLNLKFLFLKLLISFHLWSQAYVPFLLNFVVVIVLVSPLKVVFYYIFYPNQRSFKLNLKFLYLYFLRSNSKYIINLLNSKSLLFNSLRVQLYIPFLYNLDFQLPFIKIPYFGVYLLTFQLCCSFFVF